MMDEAWLPGVGDPFTTHRVERWWVELLTNRDGAVGTLDGVSSLTCNYRVAATIPSSGSLAIDDLGQDIDWLNARVRPWVEVVGAEPWPLGVFLTASPYENNSEPTVSRTIDLYDKISVVDSDAYETTFVAAIGEVVTDVVREVLESTGETGFAITPSAETLDASKIWPAGTSKLEIVNDLLDSINYFSLRCDGYGRFVVAPYARPQDRPVARDFAEGELAIHHPDFGRREDLSKVPNKVILKSFGASIDEALVGVATNTDPASRFSYPSRGRWIVTVEEGVEATSQDVIDGLADRRLASLSSASATLDLQHALVPLALNDVISFATRGREALAVVQTMSLRLDRGKPSKLVKTSAREVVV